MTIVGLMIVGLTDVFGHSYVDGVGYGVIQAILDHRDDQRSGLLALLFVMKLLATTISLGSGASGGIFSPSLLSRRDARGRLRRDDGGDPGCPVPG